MGNRINIDERYAEGVVHIAPEFFKRASEENKVELLARENSRAVLGSEYNIYIRIKGTRLVLLHIKQNWYTLINERVWCKKMNKWVQVAKRLSNGFHFNVSDGEITTAPRVKHHCKTKTLAIYRIIMSYHLYGCVNGLESTKDVHHVEDRYMNTINCLRYVDEKIHYKFHSEKGNESKREGKIIHSYEEFLKFIDSVKRIDKMASVLPM